MECLFCDQKPNDSGNLCSECGAKLQSLELQGMLDGGTFFVGAEMHVGMSLWAYRDLVRDAILGFKVKSRWLSGKALIQIGLQHRRIEFAVEGVDAIMSVPSSFWGRIRGRYDFAAIFAQSLSRHLGVPYVEPPRRLLGRWKKQALIARDRRTNLTQKLSPCWDAKFFEKKTKGMVTAQRPRILLVDDVVTTARTLTELTDRFRNIDFRILTLASAYRQGSDALA